MLLFAIGGSWGHRQSSIRRKVPHTPMPSLADFAHINRREWLGALIFCSLGMVLLIGGMLLAPTSRAEQFVQAEPASRPRASSDNFHLPKAAKRPGLTQALGLMKDKFAELEEPKKRTLPAALVVLALMGGFTIHHLSNTKPIQLAGVIQSATDPQQTTVLLDNGLLVTASASKGVPLAKGEHVLLLEKTSLFAAPVYQITGKGSLA